MDVCCACRYEATGSVSTYMLPRDAFAFVFVLLLFENQFDEQLLQFFVAVIDAELLETKKWHSRIFVQAVTGITCCC